MDVNADQILDLISALPQEDKNLAYELIKKLVLAWDPDFTKLTPNERADLEQARLEYQRGEYVNHEDINWD